MDFLNHREGVMVFYQVFLLSLLRVQKLNCRNCKRLREFEEMEVSRQSCTCRSECEKQGGKLLRLCLDSVQEFGLWMLYQSMPRPIRRHVKGNGKAC
jgi:hypothetical protein